MNDTRRPDTDLLDRLMTLWQQPWSEPAFGEAQMLLAALATIAAQPEPLDVERIIEAEHLWCVKVDGDYAFRHEPEAHREQAEFLAARLSAPTDEPTP